MPDVYFRDAKGCKVHLQVSDDIAEAMQEYRRAEWRGDANAKNHTVSLEALEKAGFMLPDNTANPLELLLERERNSERYNHYRQLKAAIKTLLPEQRRLIYLLYVKGLSLKEIAAKMKITYQAVQDRRNKILRKLNKFFE